MRILFIAFALIPIFVPLTLLAVLVAIARPSFGASWSSAVARLARPLVRRRWLGMMTVGAIPLLFCLCWSAVFGLPVATVHDEFSYLLAADTYANGRLTNPPHPLSEHFQTYHVLQQPTYQSKYPPAQGAVLAIGQVVFRYPIGGVWLSLAAACAALYWMLLAWLPGRWALLGALLMAINPPLVYWWGVTYWGGAVAMLGGCLLFGALPRIIRHQRLRDAMALAVGVVLLANSRPYEGFLTCLPVAIVLARWMLSKGAPPFSALARNVVVPVAAVLIPAAAWMGYYNWRVTGDALQMPYQRWLAERGAARTTATLTAAMTQPLGVELSVKSRQLMDQWMALEQSFRFATIKVAAQYFFYVGVPLSVYCLALPAVVRRPWGRFALITCMLPLTAVLLNAAPGFPHYIAPLTAIFAFVLVQSIRYARHWHWQGCSWGRSLVRLTLWLCAAAPLLHLGSVVAERDAANVDRWSLCRAALQRELQDQSGRHVILVHYSPEHIWHHEWVYNAARIDEAPVVWARDLGTEKNRQLLEYFPEHQVWLLEADADQPNLVRYERNHISDKNSSIAHGASGGDN